MIDGFGDVVYLISALLDIPLLTMSFRTLQKRRGTTTPRLVFACMLTTAAYTFARLLLANLAVIELPVLALIVGGYTLLCYTVRPVHAFAFGALFCTFSSVVVSVSFKVFDFQFGYGIIGLYAMSLALSTAAKIVFAWYIHHRVERFFAMNLEWLQIVLLAFLWPIDICVLAYGRPQVSNPFALFLAQPPMLVLMLCLLAILSILWLMEYASYHETRLYMERLNWALKSQRELFESQRANDEALRSIHHDLKHFYSYLEAGAAEGEAARKLLEQMEHDLQPRNRHPLTGNGTVDALLVSKTAEAKRIGLDLHAYMDLSKGDFIRDIDYLRILGNALDNAIEAAAKVSDPQHRLIQIKSGIINDHLVITVRNWFDGRIVYENGGYVTTKPDRGSHGYGMANILGAVRAYDGEVACDTRNDVFELKAIIPLPKKGEQH